MSERADHGNDPIIETGMTLIDGHVVDWSAMRGRAKTPEQRALMRELEDIDEIVTFFRTLHESEEDAERRMPTRWGRLEIRGMLGSGAFADVYDARDPELERSVALKLMRGAAAADEAFLAEGRRLARVRHRGVVTIFGAERHEGRVGLWMERLEGHTLQDVVARQGPMSAAEAITVATELLSALAAVHDAGVVHGDIKAQNVMRETGGRLVLMDFGAGREREGAPVRDREVTSGTPMYLAPEVLAGSAKHVASDIFAVGVLLYHLVSGRYPIAARSVTELREAHARGASTPLRDVRSDLPTGFVRVVQHALSVDPAERFRSAGEMERALLALNTAGAAGERTVSDATGDRAGARRSIGRVVIFSALACLVVALIVWRVLPGAGAYTVDAQLMRSRDGVTSALQPGAAVAPGDGLFLELRASTDLFLYVIAEDDNGETYLLHPLPGRGAVNPLAGGQSHRLPPGEPGREPMWGVSSAGGREHLLLVANTKPLAELESLIASLPEPTSTDALARPFEDATRVLRGIGHILPPQPRAEGRQSAIEQVERLLPEEAGPTTGVWVRRLTLENPGR